MISQLGFPAIRKPSLGGIGRGVTKIDDDVALEEISYLTAGCSGYVLLQEFVKSRVPFDYRVCICGDEVLAAHTRTLVDGWLGSRSSGSQTAITWQLPMDVEDLCLRASQAIDAYLNCLDVVISEKGPVVIENNSTPNFCDDYPKMYRFDPIERIVQKILSDYPANVHTETSEPAHALVAGPGEALST